MIGLWQTAVNAVLREASLREVSAASVALAYRLNNSREDAEEKCSGGDEGDAFNVPAARQQRAG